MFQVRISIWRGIIQMSSKAVPHVHTHAHNYIMYLYTNIRGHTYYTNTRKNKKCLPFKLYNYSFIIDI